MKEKLYCLRLMFLTLCISAAMCGCGQSQAPAPSAVPSAAVVESAVPDDSVLEAEQAAKESAEREAAEKAAAEAAEKEALEEELQAYSDAVDAYNEAIDDYNDAISEYNSVITSVNASNSEFQAYLDSIASSGIYDATALDQSTITALQYAAAEVESNIPHQMVLMQTKSAVMQEDMSDADIDSVSGEVADLQERLEKLNERTEKYTARAAELSVPDYSTQEAELAAMVAAAQESIAAKVELDSQTPTPEPTPEEKMVWVASSGNGTKYHYKSTCSNMKNPEQIGISSAKAQGYTACKKSAGG